MANRLKYGYRKGITRKQAKTVKRTITIPSIVNSYLTLVAIENKQSFSETASRQEKWDKVETGKDYPKYDLVPSGRLYFKIDELYSLEWKDGKSLLIEMQLDRIIAKIESELIRLKNEALEWQERKKIQAENKIIKEAHERLVSNELQKFNKVLKVIQLQQGKIKLNHMRLHKVLPYSCQRQFRI